MSTRTRLLSCVLVLLPVLSFAQALDPSTVTLNAASAEKFVRATQAMAASGQGPSMQGGGPGLDLAKIKASIDANAAAQKALATAGISSTDYVLFLGAAMQSMMVGQMEMAGMRNMLPPGVTKRPSQANIDFMKANMDLFQRSMTPGAPRATPRARGREHERRSVADAEGRRRGAAVVDPREDSVGRRDHRVDRLLARRPTRDHRARTHEGDRTAGRVLRQSG